MTPAKAPEKGLSNHPFFSFGFRPFFLLASLWAAIVLPLWVASYQMGLSIPFTQIDMHWHVHEMVFGYGGAVLAGFSLTAIPNWTGRPPIAGRPLIALVVLWGVGRGAYMLTLTPDGVAAVLDAAFLFVLSALVWREIVSAKNRRNIKVAITVSLFAFANAVFHFADLFASSYLPLAIRFGLAVLLFLVLLIGGRITPTFTRNWLVKRNLNADLATDKFDDLVLVASALSLAGWVVAPDHVAASSAMILTGVLTLLRMSRWRGLATLPEPLLFVLHIAHIWAGAAFLLLGGAGPFSSLVPAIAGTHALGAGAIGVMTIAVMVRATLGHTGRPLTATLSTVFMFVCVNIAALTRVAGAFLEVEQQMWFNSVSAILWVVGFLTFARVCGPLIVRERQSAGA